MADVHLTGKQLEFVRRVFLVFAPDAVVHVFGSRATGRRLKKFSDLDLLIDTPEPLPLDELDTLRGVFAESSLPFRVDLVERADVRPSFLAAIEADGLIPLATAIPATSIASA